MSGHLIMTDPVRTLLVEPFDEESRICGRSPVFFVVITPIFSVPTLPSLRLLGINVQPIDRRLRFLNRVLLSNSILNSPVTYSPSVCHIQCHVCRVGHQESPILTQAAVILAWLQRARDLERRRGIARAHQREH